MYKPFWADLPHCDIFNCFTSDLLYQLYKGIFKDHLVQWCTQLIGEKELDKQFKAMNGYLGLRHFKKGISSVSQWTGTEHKEMENILLGIAIGSVPGHFIHIVRSLIDFIYLSQLQLHTLTTLKSLESCLKTFHLHKNIVFEHGIRDHFNIPKLHAVLHYVDCIRSLGLADGYNTGSPERLHIDYVKEAYRASNKRDYIEQMAIWLEAWSYVALGILSDLGQKLTTEYVENKGGVTIFPTHYSLHAPTSCLLFLVYILISFYRLFFLSCTALLFMPSLMHSTITHAQSCTVCLLMHSLLRCSLVTQYIRTG